MIENTNDPAAKTMLLADLLGGVTGSEAVYAQEARGQAQIVRSESLPTDTGSTPDETFTALGFTFGAANPADPLFRPAALPEGWTKRATEHSMWSEIVDTHGRVRVMVFYKAAFYDRRAYMRIENLDGYVYRLMHKNETPVLDDTWATRDAVVAALVEYRNTEQGYADRADSSYADEARRNIDRAQALIESLA